MIWCARRLWAENQSTIVKEPGFAGGDNDVAIAEAEPFSIALKDPGTELIFVPREGHGLAGNQEQYRFARPLGCEGITNLEP